MGSRSSTPMTSSSSGRGESSRPPPAQKNKALGLSLPAEGQQQQHRVGIGPAFFPSWAGGADKRGRRFSNILDFDPAKKEKKGGKKKHPKRKGRDVKYKKVHVSPKKNGTPQHHGGSGRSKSEPSPAIVGADVAFFGSDFGSDFGSEPQTSKPYNSPYSTPVHSQKPLVSPSPSAPRPRLLQVGRPSPVDPLTRLAKIPTLPKTGPFNAILSDSHECTGHVPGGTRSLNQEVWYAACTRAGNDANAKRKPNQDTFFMEDCVGGNPNVHMFGVFDGHGASGHVCSHYVRDCILGAIGARNKGLVMGSDPRPLLEKAVREAQAKLSANKDINSKFSGCTGTMVAVDTKSKTLYSCNVGDSRIILGRGKQRTATVVELTLDHSPDAPKERERIEKCGGRVADFSGVPRVCLKKDNIPGLAMSRSFGDDLAKSIGVSCVPDTATRTFNQDDRFIVLGSDGIFDFMSHRMISSSVSDMIRKNKDPQEACTRLVCDAVKRWTRGRNKYVDDVTCIVVYLNSHPGRGKIKT